MVNDFDLDRLKKDLESIVLESRSSLSIENICSLQKCIHLLEELKRQVSKRGSFFTTEQIIVMIVEILIKVFLSSELEYLLHQIHQ